MREIKPKKDSYMLGVGPEKPMKPKEMPPEYPKLRLDLDVVPEAKKWEVSDAGSSKGSEYTVTLKVKMIGLSQSRFDKTAEFELRGVEVGDYEEGEKESDE